MNIAASGVGKSQSRKRLIAEPLEYMIHDKELKIPDFEVCKFTRVGKCSLVILNYVFINIIIFYMFLPNMQQWSIASNIQHVPTHCNNVHYFVEY